MRFIALAPILVFPTLFLTLNCDNQLYKFLNDAPVGHRTKLVIANAGIPVNLVNFPLMVRLESTRVNYAEFKSGGADIRFYDSDAVTSLSYEIERWDTSGTSVIWVKVPQIDANSSSDYIWMYYGNEAAVDAQSVNAVWDTNFKGVWHFAATAGATDSTSNGVTGVNSGVTLVDAAAGKGYAFNGTSNWINLANGKAILGGNSVSTVSAWTFFSSSVISVQQILALSVNNSGVATSTSRLTFTALATNQFEAGGRAPDSVGTNQVQTSTTGPIVLDSWQYLTAVTDYAAKTVDLYVNGAQVADTGTALAWTSSTLDSTASASAAIGSEDDGSSSFFAGRMDEVRISNTGRSAAWIQADYKSMSDTYLTFIRDY